MFQLTLTTDSDTASQVCGQLEQTAAIAVNLTDARDEPIYEPGVGETPLWKQTRVLAWFSELSDAHAAREVVQRYLGRDSISIEPVSEKTWQLSGRIELQPLCFADTLWVIPPEQARAYCNKPHVLLTPGLAFGTGSHPTTALCLEWLSRQELYGKSLVDYGCGSGILGVAALKLGAERVVAIDHDPQAITATRDNARRNGVEHQLSALLPHEYYATPADIVVANIVLNPLIDLAAQFARMVKPRGRVVLSGVMKDQVQPLYEAYATWFDLEYRLQDDWACVVGRAHQ